MIFQEKNDDKQHLNDFSLFEQLSIRVLPQH